MSETNTKRIVVNSVLPSLPLSVEHTPEHICDKHLPFTGRGVKICLIDSGVPDHEALITLGGDINFSKSPDTRDHTGHATVLAGLMVANKPDQLLGLAPNALIMSAKAIDDSCILRFDALVASLLWGIISEADIIAIPICSEIDSPALRAAVDKALNAGITIMASAGNSSKVEFPAKYDGVISVGTLGTNGKLASYSGQGVVNLPGTNLESTYLEQTYCVASGTSVSTGIATGLCARIIEKLKAKKTPFTSVDVLSELKALCK